MKLNCTRLLPILFGIVSFLLFSCSKNINSNENASSEDTVKVVELEVKPVAEEIELFATTETLSKFDCDLDWLLFDFNSSELTEKSRSELHIVSGILKKNNLFKARLRAYTDNVGSKEYNQKLSLKRANAAKAYLMDLGISQDNISVGAFADTNPIAKNTDDDAGRRFNRRIELFIIDDLGNTVCRSHPPKVPVFLKTTAD